MIQERLDVFFKTGDDDGIGEEVLVARCAAVFEVLAGAALFAICAVAYKGDDEAQATVMSSLEDVVKLPEGVRIELPKLRFDAEFATDAVAHGLRTDDPGAHHFGGVEGVIDFKAAGKADPRVRAGHNLPGLATRCRAAVTEGLHHPTISLVSVALHEFIVVPGLRRTPGTHCHHGHATRVTESERAPQQVGFSHPHPPPTMSVLHPRNSGHLCMPSRPILDFRNSDRGDQSSRLEQE